MKRTIKLLSIALLGLALSCPPIEARGRNNGNNGNGASNNTTQVSRSNTPTNRGANGNANTGRGANGNASRPTQAQTTRPNNGGSNGRPNNGNNANRPGNNSNTSRPNNTQTNRPGNNGGNPGQNYNPGNNGGNPGQNFNPGNPGGAPGHNFNPGNPGGNRPGDGVGPGYGHNNGPIPNYAPNRPMMPTPSPFYRPTPPPHFRPGPRYPVINTILGVTIGTAINATLNYLLNDGYYVTGYTNDAVYLNDVMQLNMMWPNATLYYSGGRLMGSEFVYSTPYYDPDRYYGAYNELTRAYGMPATTQNIGLGGMQCTWFGYNGQYVTLQYNAGVAANGMSRYYTTLSFGI